MERPVVQAMVDAGIVDENALKQLQRWVQPGLEITQEPGGANVSAVSVANMILDAVSNEESVEMRDTDLDVVKEYLANGQKAKLHVPNPEPSGRDTVGFTVTFCMTQMGEIVIPWTSEAINDTLLDPATYLKPVGKDRIYFADVRELFYGDHKAFMVCTPAKDVR